MTRSFSPKSLLCLCGTLLLSLLRVLVAFNRSFPGYLALRLEQRSLRHFALALADFRQGSPGSSDAIALPIGLQVQVTTVSLFLCFRIVFFRVLPLALQPNSSMPSCER